MVSFIGRSLRIARSKSRVIMMEVPLRQRCSCRDDSEVGQIDLFLPVRLEQDAIDQVDINRRASG